jgi:hypothetical protein
MGIHHPMGQWKRQPGEAWEASIWWHTRPPPINFLAINPSTHSSIRWNAFPKLRNIASIKLSATLLRTGVWPHGDNLLLSVHTGLTVCPERYSGSQPASLFWFVYTLFLPIYSSCQISSACVSSSSHCFKENCWDNWSFCRVLWLDMSLLCIELCFALPTSLPILNALNDGHPPGWMRGKGQGSIVLFSLCLCCCYHVSRSRPVTGFSQSPQLCPLLSEVTCRSPCLNILYLCHFFLIVFLFRDLFYYPLHGFLKVGAH